MLQLPRKTRLKLFQSFAKPVNNHMDVVFHTLSGAAANVAGLVKTLPTKVQEQVITTLLKEKKSPELSLATKGTPLRVVINPKPVSEPFVFSETGLDNFRSTNQLSGKFMGSLCNFVRTEAGKKAIPAHF